jgi:predicted DNA-binding ribbon-helix-helix protein
MRPSIRKRSIIVRHHRTSVSLEDDFWSALKEIVRERDSTLSDMIVALDSERQQGNLSSAIRLFVFDFYRNLAFRPLAKPSLEVLKPDGPRPSY